MEKGALGSPSTLVAKFTYLYEYVQKMSSSLLKNVIIEMCFETLYLIYV